MGKHVIDGSYRINVNKRAQPSSGAIFLVLERTSNT